MILAQVVAVPIQVVTVVEVNLAEVGDAGLVAGMAFSGHLQPCLVGQRLL